MEQIQIIAAIDAVRAEMRKWGLDCKQLRPLPTTMDSTSWWYASQHNVLGVGPSSGDAVLDAEYLHHELVHWHQPEWTPDYYTPEGDVDLRRWLNNRWELPAILVARCIAEPWIGDAIREIVGAKPWRGDPNGAHRKVGAAFAAMVGKIQTHERWITIRRMLPNSSKLEVVRQLFGKEPKKKLTRTERKALKRLRGLLSN